MIFDVGYCPISDVHGLAPALTGVDCRFRKSGAWRMCESCTIIPPRKTYQIFVQPSRRQLSPLYLDVEEKLLRIFREVLFWSECPLPWLLRLIMLHLVASMQAMATGRRPYTPPSYQYELRHAFTSATRRISKSNELLKPSGC